MAVEQPEVKPGFLNAMTSSEDRYSRSSVVDARISKKPDYSRSLSQERGRKMSSYFTLESMFLLVCLTASLLILPLVLPPLPPPPVMLLLLPICILALLMILAFMPSNARDVTYTYTYV